MQPSANHYYEFGPFRVEPEERVLLRAGELVPLTPKAFETLLVLVERHGRVVDKDEILKRVWPDSFIEDSTLAKNIWTLRKVFGAEEADQSYIETIPKRGYRFVAPVKEVVGEESITPPPQVAQEPEIENPPVVADKLADRVEVGATPPLPSQSQRPRRLVWATALLFAGLAAALAVWWMVFRPAPSSALPNAKVVPLTTFPGREFDPAFSPDGNQIAFVWGGEKDDNLDVYVKLINEGSPLRLTTNAGDDINPVWSPDGLSIAFYRQSPEGSAVYLVPALGGAERKLADAFPYRPGVVTTHTYLHWSPNGEWLALVDKGSPQEPFSIMLIARETGERRLLTKPPPAIIGDFSPAFSPDGKSLAFVRINSGTVEDLYTVPLSGGEPTRLTFDYTRISDLAWTPDDREIVISSRRSGIHCLWRVPVAGGEPTWLTVSGYNISGAAFSRSGSSMAWTQTNSDANISRLGLSGLNKTATKLIASTLTDNDAQYSPDGKRIVFSSNRSGNFEIWACGSEGENPIQLTSFRGAHAGTPRWSPDGQQVVFDCRTEGNPDIYAVSSEGGKPRRLTATTSDDVLPSWSRDGRWIYFASNRSGQMQIWKMPAAGEQEAVQVTQQGGFEAFASHDGQWLYYTKGRGLSAVWRIPVAGGAETPVFDFRQPGYSRVWALTAEGIYFAAAEPSTPPAIKFFSFATNQTTTVATIERGLPQGVSGLAISPDRNWLLYPQIEQQGSDIILMENFR